MLSWRPERAFARLEGRLPYAAPLVLLGVVLAIYGRSVGFDFLSWDDDQNVVNNRWLFPDLWTRFWYRPYLCMFIPPVYTLWFLLSQVMTPLSPHLYHGANVLVHAVNCWLIYRLAFATVAVDSGIHRGAAALVAGLWFALHPLQVETVAWVTGMRDLLSASGALAAALCFLGTRHGYRSAILGWLCFVFAMLCKPSAVALPAGLFAVAVVAHGRPARRVLFELVPWFAAVIPIIWVTHEAQVEIADTATAALGFGQRLVVALDGYGFYLQKALVPRHLMTDYGRIPRLVLGGDGLAMHGCLVAVCLLAAWFWRRRIGRQALGWLLFTVLVILPTSGVVPFAFQHTSTVADHYIYLGMAGLALAGAALLARIPAHLSTVLTTVLLAAWAALSALQLSFWRNDEALFPAMVATNPRSYAGWTGLAALAMRQKHFEEALANLLEAERIEPLKVDLLANKALALNELGRYQQVLDEIAPKLPNKQIVIASPISAPSVSVMFMMVAYAELKLDHFAAGLPYLCMAKWADDHNNDVKTFMPVVLQRLGRSADDPTLCAPFIN